MHIHYKGFGALMRQGGAKTPCRWSSPSDLCKWLETQETMSADVDAFVALTQKYVDVPELTPTIVNEYIKKIEVFAPDKSSGKRVQKVKIYFNFVDDVEIPVVSELVVAKSTPGRRKTA